MSEHVEHSSVHGHHHDRGWRAVVRYVRLSRRMWTSPINRAVIGLLDVRASEWVLDVGAGMGAGAVVAAKAGAHVIAVEPTPFLRRVLAARRLAQRSRNRIEVLDGAAEHLPLPDASVDAAWAVNTMHHWSDLDAAVAELERVLRRGGRVLLVDEDFDDPAHVDHDRVDARRHKQHLAFPEIDPAVVGEKLAAHGFDVQKAAKTELAGRPAKVLLARKT
ncbi:MAG: class I SAM-dependent methyltransferase [Acidimicrobiia bacterium]